MSSHESQSQASTSQASQASQASTSQASQASQASQPTKALCLIIVAGQQRREASLACASSLLRLQTALMGIEERVRADLHVVTSTNDALNVLRNAGADTEGALVVHSTVGFDPDFLIRALRSQRGLVLASYPLPIIDWARVEERGKAGEEREPPEMWGNVYSVEPAEKPGPDGYARVSQVRDLSLFWIRKPVLDDIARRHPEVVAGEHSAFCVPGVFGGQYMDAEQRFVSLLDGTVEAWADVDTPAVNTGPAEFAGCVGARRELR